MNRSAKLERQTGETLVRCSLDLDGTGESKARTGLGFLDHMIETLGRHARFDLDLHCDGDIHVDDHHSVEDTAIVLGQAIDRCLGTRTGIERFGDATVPLDEALSRAAVDLSGRPWPVVELGLQRDTIGAVAAENLEHFFNSLAIAGRFALHVDVLRGKNDHHRVESAFKAVARALRASVQRTGDVSVPSTKGVL
jgi:imidazoleglycerol phosphate dehydratase HisB